MAEQNLIPSPYAAILYQARSNPHAPAVVLDGTVFSYSDFCFQVERLTRHLHELALSPGQRVAVIVGSAYVHCLLVLALSRLGVEGCLAAPETLQFLLPDVVITDRPAEVPDYKSIEFKMEWFERPSPHLPRFVDRLHAPDDPCRIVLCISPLERVRPAALTYGQMHKRVRQQMGDMTIGPTSRVFSALGLNSAAGLTLHLACWAAGGAVLVPHTQRDQVKTVLLRSRPNLLALMPAQLETLVSSLPPTFVASPELRAFSVGGPISDALNRSARARLSSSLCLVYERGETGTIAMAPAAHADSSAKDGFCGYVLPPAQVEIVNDQGEPLATGTTGELRIRAEGQLHRYLNDAQATAQAFRDGWFYPGEMATITPRGDLVLIGHAPAASAAAAAAPEMPEDAPPPAAPARTLH